MIRKIIHIDEEKCNGCGLCAEACSCGRTSVMGSVTACQDVRLVRSLLKSVKPRNTMKQQ